MTLPVERIKCRTCGFPKWPSAFTGGVRGGTSPDCRTCRGFQREIRDLRNQLTRAEQRVATYTRSLADAEARFLAYQHGEDTKRRWVVSGPRHGRITTYREHGCRCAACTAVMQAHWRTMRRAA